MADTSLSKKLGIKPDYTLLVLNAPQGYTEKLEAAPDSVATIASGDTFDFVQLFVHNKADIERLAPTAIQALKPGGLLWLTYPKKTSAIKTDIHRDSGWESVNEAGYRIVSLIAIDETWSAGRFRPYSEVKATSDRFGPQ